VRSDRGRFVLQGVLPGLVRLRIEAPRYASETVSLQVSEPDRARGPGGALPSVALQRAGVVEGEVTEVTGQAVVGATASIGRLSSVTGPTGRFKIDRVPRGTTSSRCATRTDAWSAPIPSSSGPSRSAGRCDCCCGRPSG